jgi:signal transduction histidine kinase
VTELLTLARVQDADPEHYRDSRIDVGAVVSAICTRRRTEAEAKKIDIRCEVPDSIDLQVRVDSRDLTDCIENVIDNAIKFTQAPGAVSIRVELDEPAARERWVVVHVDDTGMGFDPDSLAIANSGGASVFDAYRRGNNALAAGIPGSGLGLAIVREVAEQAGGRIEIQSVQGSGTQFTLRFPACVDGEVASVIRNTRTTHAHTGGPSVTTDETHRRHQECKEAQHALC